LQRHAKQRKMEKNLNFKIKVVIVFTLFFMLIGLLFTWLLCQKKEIDPFAYLIIPCCFGGFGFLMFSDIYQYTEPDKPSPETPVIEPNNKQLEEEKNQKENKDTLDKTKKRKITITIYYDSKGKKQQGTFERVDKH